MKKTKKIIKTPEELEKEWVERKRQRVLDELKFTRTSPIRRIFEIGELVVYGGFHETVILESYEGGMYYKVRTTSAEKAGHPEKMTYSTSDTFVAWYSLFRGKGNDFNFSNENAIRLNFGQTDLECLLSRVHHGVDLDVDYQRGYVWSQGDKESLIESVLAGCEIGKMVFVKRPFSVDGHLYEILDGKQRYSTLLDFIEDQITYKGYKFSELSGQDRYVIRRTIVSYADIQADQYDKKQILEIFYRLNRHGKVMDQSHLETVKKMIEELKRE